MLIQSDAWRTASCRFRWTGLGVRMRLVTKVFCCFLILMCLLHLVTDSLPVTKILITKKKKKKVLLLLSTPPVLHIVALIYVTLVCFITNYDLFFLYFFLNKYTAHRTVARICFTGPF